MKKLTTGILSSILIFCFTQIQTHATSINSVIKESGINKSSISISVKELSTGKAVYSLNDKVPSIPASTLKPITYSAALDTLGKDFEFTTSLYKNDADELFIKLGADPFLTSSNLNKLFKIAKDNGINEPKNIYIDDNIIDKTEWGEGWQWDDDLNPLMPKFSAYNIDKNLLEIIITPVSNGAPPLIKTSKFYPITFMNFLTYGSDNRIKISRNNAISPNTIALEGTIKTQYSKEVPLNNIRRYFLLRLEDALKNAKIAYYGNFITNTLPPKNLYLVDNITHPISLAEDEILKKSNNMVAESVFKIAGSKFTNNIGTQENSILMVYTYLDKLGVNRNDIKITDGSGVSKNNIITADFMTDFLVKQATYNSDFINTLPTSGEGTLKNRMLYFKDNLRAKTGTLSDVSSIAGYLKTRNGKIYAFDIIINDPKSKESDKKTLEEHILREIYVHD